MHYRNDSVQRRPSPLKPYLIVTQVVYVLALIPWSLVFIMSPMMFDAGVAVWNSITFGFIAAYPVALIISSILAWRLRRRARSAVVYFVGGIPALWIVVAAVSGLATTLGFLH